MATQAAPRRRVHATSTRKSAPIPNSFMENLEPSLRSNLDPNLNTSSSTPSSDSSYIQETLRDLYSSFPNMNINSKTTQESSSTTTNASSSFPFTPTFSFVPNTGPTTVPTGNAKPMGKENDAPKSTNIPSFNFQQNSFTMETLKKENDDLKRQNEDLKFQLENSKKFQLDSDAKIISLTAENEQLKYLVEQLNKELDSFKYNEKVPPTDIPDLSKLNEQMDNLKMNNEQSRPSEGAKPNTPENTTKPVHEEPPAEPIDIEEIELTDASPLREENIKVETVEQREQEDYEEISKENSKESFQEPSNANFFSSSSFLFNNFTSENSSNFQFNNAQFNGNQQSSDTGFFSFTLNNILGEETTSTSSKTKSRRRKYTVPKVTPTDTKKSSPKKSSPKKTSEKPSTTSQSAFEQPSEEQAEFYKNLGNSAFMKNNFIDAINYYTKAINFSITPSAVYFGNRGASYLMAEKFNEALNDCEESIKIDPYFYKGYTRAAHCYLQLGSLEKAEQKYKELSDIMMDGPSNKRKECQETIKEGMLNIDSIKSEWKLYNEKLPNNPEIAYKHASNILKWCPHSVQAKVAQGNALQKMKRWVELRNLFSKENSTEMHYSILHLKATAEYFLGNFSESSAMLTTILNTEPSHELSKKLLDNIQQFNLKKQQGNDAYTKEKYQESFNIYNTALEIDIDHDLMNRVFYANRAAALMKLERYKEALRDCSKAIELDPNYLKAYLRRAKLFASLENYADAIKDYESALKLDSSPATRAELREMQLKLRKEMNKNYYEILEIEPTAVGSIIKKAYKKMALKWHPDKNTEVDMKSFAETQFKAINEAFSTLSDPVKRRDYDLEILTKKANSFYDKSSDYYSTNNNFPRNGGSWGAWTSPRKNEKKNSPKGAWGRKSNWDNF